MTDVLFGVFQCRILAHGKNVLHRIALVSRKLYADGADPWEYECRRCHQTWNDAVLTDPRLVTCSNCYSDNIVLTALRVDFRNWGEQKGGILEQRERWELAKKFASFQPISQIPVRGLDGTLARNSEDEERRRSA